MAFGLPVVFEGYDRTQDLEQLAIMLISDMNYRGLGLNSNEDPAIKLDQPILEAIQNRLKQTNATPD
jgi:hypothetical protein